MEWFKGVRSRHTRAFPELEQEIPPELHEIMNSLEDVQNFLNKNRKSFEISGNVVLQRLQSVESKRSFFNGALLTLQTTHNDLAKYHQKFCSYTNSTFGPVLKRWLERCSELVKMKGDLQKSFSEYNKMKDKLLSSQSKDSDALRHAVDGTESTYRYQKEMLCLELFKYRMEYKDYEKTLMDFLVHQREFLKSCYESADARLEETSPRSDKSTDHDTQSKSYFGSSLKDHVDTDGYSILLKKCLAYLVKNELYNQEGIFRVAGQVSRIALLREALDKDMADAALFEFCGVFVVADVIKQYLRELREPILTREFVKNWPSKPTSSVAYSLMQDHLPEVNRKNLILIVQFLGKVVDSPTSKMTPENLATTLYMNFYRQNSEDTCGVTDFGVVAPIIQLLAKKANKIVKDEKDIAQILECATQTPTPPLPVGWRTPAAFSPHPSSVTPPQVPDRTYYEQNRPSVCEPTQKQRAPPPPVPRMSSSSAVPPRYSAQTSSGDGGSAKLSASSLNQAPLKPPIPPPVGGGSASSDQRQSTSNGPITSFDIAKHPVSSQSENQYDVPLDSEYTSEASGPPGDGYVSPNYSNEEPSKDTAPPEVPKTGEDPERNVPTEAKDTQANEAKDVAAVVQEAKGQSSTEASRKTSGVDGTEEVKPILRNPGKKEKGRDSSGDLPEFCKVKESLDRKRISVPSMGNAPAESGSERCKSSTPASNSNANENAKPLRQ